MSRRSSHQAAHKKQVAQTHAGFMEDRTVTAQGRTYVFSSGISQFTAIPLRPSALDDRCIAIADLYVMWRPKSVRFRAISLGNTANVVIAHMYPDAVTASITTMEEAIDLPAFKCGSGSFGAPLPDLYLDEQYFRSTRMTQWFTTTSVPTDTLLENAGNLWYGNENSTFSTNNFRGIIEWEFEFKSMVDPQVSLRRIRERAETQDEKTDEEVVVITTPPTERMANSTQLAGTVPISVEGVRKKGTVHPSTLRLVGYFKTH